MAIDKTQTCGRLGCLACCCTTYFSIISKLFDHVKTPFFDHAQTMCAFDVDNIDSLRLVNDFLCNTMNSVGGVSYGQVRGVFGRCR